MGIGSFSGLKRAGCGADHPLASSAEVKERVELYLYSPSGPLLLQPQWYYENFTSRGGVQALFSK